MWADYYWITILLKSNYLIKSWHFSNNSNNVVRPSSNRKVKHTIHFTMMQVGFVYFSQFFPVLWFTFLSDSMVLWSWSTHIANVELNSEYKNWHYVWHLKIVWNSLTCPTATQWTQNSPVSLLSIPYVTATPNTLHVNANIQTFFFNNSRFDDKTP